MEAEVMNSITVLFFVVFGIFSVLVIIPLIPTLLAIYKKEDTAPLAVDLGYTQNPRYLAEKFEDEYQSKKDDFFKTIPIEKELTSSLVKENKGKEFIFYSEENIHINDVLSYPVHVVSEQNIEVEKASIFYALKAKGDITLNAGAEVLRWMDAGNKIELKNKSKVNTASAKTIVLYPGVEYKKLYASSGIKVFSLEGKDEFENKYVERHMKTKEDIEEDTLYIKEKSYYINKGSIINQDVIGKGDISVGSKCKIFGTIKANNNLYVAKGTIIYGDLFAEKDIVIEEDCIVLGNIFSHTYVTVGKNTQVGQPKYHHKSLIATKGVTLSQGVVVHNYILTYGRGSVV